MGSSPERVNPDPGLEQAQKCVCVCVGGGGGKPVNLRDNWISNGNTYINKTTYMKMDDNINMGITIAGSMNARS